MHLYSDGRKSRNKVEKEELNDQIKYFSEEIDLTIDFIRKKSNQFLLPPNPLREDFKTCNFPTIFPDDISIHRDVKIGVEIKFGSDISHGTSYGAVTCQIKNFKFPLDRLLTKLIFYQFDFYSKERWEELSENNKLIKEGCLYYRREVLLRSHK